MDEIKIYLITFKFYHNIKRSVVISSININAVKKIELGKHVVYTIDTKKGETFLSHDNTNISISNFEATLNEATLILTDNLVELKNFFKININNVTLKELTEVLDEDTKMNLEKRWNEELTKLNNKLKKTEIKEDFKANLFYTWAIIQLLMSENKNQFHKVISNFY